MKRLEQGTFVVPFAEGATPTRCELTAPEFSALLSGIDLAQATVRKRYRRT